MIARPHRPACGAVLLGAAVSLTACGVRDPGVDHGPDRNMVEQASNVDEATARNIRTIDGDTIEVRGERIRLANIDAPEKPPRARCYAEARMAWEARDHLDRLVNGYYSTENLKIAREGKDRYGRTLALVSIEGNDVGRDLIEAGLAVPWRGQRWDWCAPVDATSDDGRAVTRDPDTAVDDLIAASRADRDAAAPPPVS